MNLVKANFGFVIFTFSKIFSMTGLIGGYTMYTFVFLINLYTMLQIVYLAARYPLTHSLSGLSYKIGGTAAKIVIDIAIIIIVFTCCCAYLFGIAEYLDRIICHYTQYCGHYKKYIMLLAIPALPISWIQTYTFLANVSILSVGVFSIGLFSAIGLLITAIKDKNGCDPSLPVAEGTCKVLYFNASAVVGHLGAGFLSFEGQATLVNMYAESKSPQDFPKVLTWAMITVISVYFLFSSLAYYTYVG